MATLNAKKRDTAEKLKKLKREGFIPGVIFGKALGESISIQFDKPEVLRFLNNNWTGSKVELVVDGQKYTAQLKEIEIQPVTRVPEHLSFLVLPSAE